MAKTKDRDPLAQLKLPSFDIVVGADFGEKDVVVVLALTCKRKDCGKTFWIRQGDELNPTAPCPHCFRVSKT